MSFNVRSFNRKRRTINCGGQLFDLSDPVVMGIINITPDSFYDGGRYQKKESVLDRVEEIIDQGGRMVDIGAYSSRPGAKLITSEEELSRLIPVINIIRKKYPELVISVDTFRSDIARILVGDYSVSIINDISGGEFDNKMFETVADLQVPYIIMHLKGTHSTMHNRHVYKDLTAEIMKYFSEKLVELTKLGVNDVIIDPGFGFSKTLDDNYELMRNLAVFRTFDLPLLIGVSRKSMIYKLLDIGPDNALNGSTVLHTYGLLGGANILRVHDVKEAAEVCRIYNKLKNL